MRFIFYFLCLTMSLQALATAPSQIQREVRLEHARELLGKHYKRSVVRRGESVSKINGRIYLWTKEHLPSAFKSRYQEIAQTIIDEAQLYEFDPVFLLSVIEGESSFNPAMRGALDEIGLMQLRPSTAQWIAGKYDIEYASVDELFDPIQNIRLGAAYLAHLREKFDSHARLYLAAYNMGARNVATARAKSIWPKDYPSHVMKFYVEFYSLIDAKASAHGRRG